MGRVVVGLWNYYKRTNFTISHVPQFLGELEPPPDKKLSRTSAVSKFKYSLVIQAAARSSRQTNPHACIYVVAYSVSIFCWCCSWIDFFS